MPRSSFFEVVAACLLVLVAILFCQSQFHAPWLPEAILAASALPIALWYRSRRTSAAALFDAGIAIDTDRGPLELRWNELEGLDDRATEYIPEDTPVRVVEHHLLTPEGADIQLPVRLVDGDQLWTIVRRKVMPRIVRRAIARVEAGVTLAFDPFEIDLAGLHYREDGRQQSIRWQVLRSIGEERGEWYSGLRWIVILTKSIDEQTPTEWARIREDRITGLLLFTALCKYLIGAAHLHGAPEPAPALRDDRDRPGV